MSKKLSVKIQNLDNFYICYRAKNANGTRATAWRVDDEIAKYFISFVSCDDQAPFDTSSPSCWICDSIDELESAMREFADLRKWIVYTNF